MALDVAIDDDDTITIIPYLINFSDNFFNASVKISYMLNWFRNVVHWYSTCMSILVIV